MVKIKNAFKSFIELRYSTIIFLCSLAPVTLGAVLLNLMVTYDNSLYTDSSFTKNYNINFLIDYISLGSFHVVLCVIVAFYFFQRFKNEKSLTKLFYIKFFRFLFILIVIVVLLVVDGLQPNISKLSHARIYELLIKSNYFEPFFQSFPKDFISFLDFNFFYTFSLFPFISIVAALIVMVSASFSISTEIAKIISLSDNESRWEDVAENLKKVSENLKNHLFLLSSVLVSSTIATILFFYLPIPLLNDELLRESYKSVSMSMGFFWGVTYSLTLLSICIFPYKILLTRTKLLIKNESIKEDKKFENWLKDNQHIYLVSENIKAILSVLSPIFASLLANLF